MVSGQVPLTIQQEPQQEMSLTEVSMNKGGLQCVHASLSEYLFKS